MFLVTVKWYLIILIKDTKRNNFKMQLITNVFYDRFVFHPHKYLKKNF